MQSIVILKVCSKTLDSIFKKNWESHQILYLSIIKRNFEKYKIVKMIITVIGYWNFIFYFINKKTVKNLIVFNFNTNFFLIKSIKFIKLYTFILYLKILEKNLLMKNIFIIYIKCFILYYFLIFIFIYNFY